MSANRFSSGVRRRLALDISCQHVGAALALSIGLVFLGLVSDRLWADADGTVVATSRSELVVRDDRGDEVFRRSSLGREKTAADIRRVRVWQHGGRGSVSVTVAGSVRNSSIRRWRAWTLLAGRGVTDPSVEVEFSRSRAWLHLYVKDGSQILCPAPVRISNGGRTVVATVPEGCHWEAVGTVYLRIGVDRGRKHYAQDEVRSSARLRWR